jgi:peroxiredoxin
LVQLRDTESQFGSLGFQIIAVSPDQPAKVRETIEKHKIAFTLLSDSQMTASRAFRIAYKVDDATLKLLAFEYINPDYTVRAHPDVLLAAASVSRK